MTAASSNNIRLNLSTYISSTSLWPASYALAKVRKIDVENSQMVEIYIKDSGKGIPRHLIDKLGQAGLSFGKDNSSQSGNGLGIYHAKKTVELFGGSLKIDSTEGIGTTVYLLLPLANSPAWFAKAIDLTNKKYLVSLDDDISIHQIWAGRLKGLGIEQLEHIKFQSSDTFEKYVNANISKLRQTLFLIDYELLNQPKTGLDIIEKLGLEKYTILVTSRYEEPDIQVRALRLKLPLLPKSLSGFVPITWNQIEKYDWVLLDDDELVHMTWGLTAKDSQKTFIGFKSYSDFNAYKHRLDFSQKIYIDSHLGNGEKGEEIAMGLYAQGFTNLYLTTGYAADSFKDMPFIRAIIGKHPPSG